ncbi:MAG: hypothetical protein HOB82_06965 [Alphaproteobacteria bacterium]|jgi:hypothetical protein|nr:hypothetical protein [Alphaproteobacteria bacterium]MBT5859581.1 hypothetical protein [Alphaproteobacteria bacterium]
MANLFRSNLGFGTGLALAMMGLPESLAQEAPNGQPALPSANACQPETMFCWVTSLPVQVQTGLIAAVATLVAILLKDLVVDRWTEHRADRRLAIEIYRNYADPIAAAASSLFWRLREVLVSEGRGAFLKTSGSATPFDKYKYDSTLFRISVLIAWLRAYARELTFFSLSDSDKLVDLKGAIRAFEAALADGAHVETQRVQAVAAHWDLTVPENGEELPSIAVAVDQILSTFLHRNNARVATELAPEKQTQLCKSVALALTNGINANSVPEGVLLETLQRTIQSLSIREAWLYRDFQSGIGDLMIRNTTGGARRFEVVGFKEFEVLLLSEKKTDQRWVNRLNRILRDLDISGADKNDARVRMIEETFLATVRLLEVLAKVDPNRDSVATQILSEGARLREDQTWRKSVSSG